jgi:hypothetical protein
MAQQAVVDAVIARLNANWTTTSVFVPNDPRGDTPADGSPFVSVQFPTATETFIAMAAVGSRLVREAGTARIVVSVPRGQGLDLGLGYCGTLAALFRLQTFSGVVCFEASPPFDNDSGDNGAYWVLSTSISYQFDFFA